MSNVSILIDFLTAVCILGSINGQLNVGPYECIDIKEVYTCESNTPNDKIQFFLSLTRREFDRCVTGHWFSEIDFDDSAIVNFSAYKKSGAEYKEFLKSGASKPITQARKSIPAIHNMLRETFNWPDDRYSKGNYTVDCFPACLKPGKMPALEYGEYLVDVNFLSKEIPHMGCIKLMLVIEPAPSESSGKH